MTNQPFSHLRLWLYIFIIILPEILQWLTLTFDTSPRGLLILSVKVLLAGATVARSYIDNNGKPDETKPVVPPPIAPVAPGQPIQPV